VLQICRKLSVFIRFNCTTRWLWVSCSAWCETCCAQQASKKVWQSKQWSLGLPEHICRCRLVR